MPEIVCKVTNEDGTEESFGPVAVSKRAATEIATALRPAEDKRQAALAAQRSTEGAEEQERRSRAAEEHNRRRAERGQRGLDPDGSD